MPVVVSHNEMFGSRDFTETLNAKGVPVLTHTRKFKVVLDDGGAGADAAAYNVSASATPLRSSHPQNFLARAKRRSGKSISNDDKVWEIDVEYDTDTASEDEQEQEKPDNPLDEPWDVEWDVEQFTKPLHVTIDNKPVVNSADEQFDPLPEIDDARCVLRVTRNEAANPVPLASRYRNVVNSDTFQGHPAGYVKSSAVRASRQTKRLKDGALQIYWRCIYEFHFLDPDGEDKWDELRILDQGYREKTDALSNPDGDQPYVGITDSQDMPIAKPAPLDGQGTKQITGDEPFFLTFKRYKRKSFAAFNMPDLF